MSLGSTTAPYWSNAEELLKAWLRRTRESQTNHYKAANQLIALDRWLGVPAIVLSTVVGTSVFASLQKDVTFSHRLLLGLLSIGAAVLMTLNTSMAFSERAERHRKAGARYAAIRRHIEEMLASPQQLRNEGVNSLASIRTSMDKLAEESPALPHGLWNEGKLPLPS